jgi:hypothetical protein
MEGVTAALHACYGDARTCRPFRAETSIGWFPGLKPISANLIKASTERMYFVPEGQHDRSQARSAWRYEENSPVPEGRLNGSWPSLDANIPFKRIPSVSKRHELRFDEQISLTTTSTVPPGRGLSTSLPRHFVPGYDQLSLRDKSHSPIEGLASS